MNETNLELIGFTKTESKVYLELIKLGSVSVSNLAKSLNKDRTTIYHVIGNLERKGVVYHTIKNNRRFYGASNPKNLLGPIIAKEKIAQKIILDIKKLKKSGQEEQDIAVYEGKESIRVLFTDILKSNLFFSFGATGKSFDILKYEMPHIIKKAIKQKLKGRIITNSKFKNHEMTKVPHMKFKYLDTVDSLATTTIYGNKIAINVYTPKPLIIFIKNKEIVKGYKNYFDFLWKQAKNK